jgi:hypothetical protein
MFSIRIAREIYKGLTYLAQEVIRLLVTRVFTILTLLLTTTYAPNRSISYRGIVYMFECKYCKINVRMSLVYCFLAVP